MAACSSSLCYPCSGSRDPRLAHAREWMFSPTLTRRRSSGFIRLRTRSPTLRPRATSLLSEAAVDDLLHNHVLLAVVTASAVGQFLKPFTSAVRGKGFDWKLSISSGGMPSVHSACVTAACTAIALERGMADSLFGLAVVFAAIVMYDSQGVRRAVGSQAKVLNTMILQSMPESFSADASDADLLTYAEGQPVASEGESLEGVMEERKKRDASMNRAAKKCIASDVVGIVDVPLKESIGHTKLEVLVGGTWGVLCTLGLSHLLPHLLIQ